MDDAHAREEPTTAVLARPRYVHPSAQEHLDKYPWVRRIPIYGEICEGYGLKVTWSLGMCYFMCKGLADYILRKNSNPVLRQLYGLSANEYQRLSLVTSLGWSMKALPAMLCDTFSFLGYTKRWYMFLACVLGSLFTIVYGLLPAQPSSAKMAAVCIFMACFSMALIDILSEGLYSRLMRRVPEPGPALVSWIWWYITLGSMISSVVVGPLSDAGMARVSLFISAAFQLLTSIIFLLNWYEERKNRVDRAEDARLMHEEILREREALMQTSRDGKDISSGEMRNTKDVHPETGRQNHEANQDVLCADPLALCDDLQVGCCQTVNGGMLTQDVLDIREPTLCMCGIFEINTEVVARNARIFAYCVVMALASITMLLGNMFAKVYVLLGLSIGVSIICCAMSFWALPPVIAKANVFMYLQMLLYIQLPGALDNFYQAKPSCLPGGPYFSNTLYITVTGVIGNVASLVGIFLFNYIFSRRGYRVTFIITTLLQIIASVFDIIMVERWNIKVGIPDRAMFVCGDVIIYNVVYMFTWMPMIVLLSQLCPRGSESMVYAIVAGFSNLGDSLSSSIGALLMETLWPVTVTDTHCDFSNVSKLLLVGHMLLPLLIIPLTLLLPNVRVCDDINVDGSASKRIVQRQMNKECDNQTNDKNRASA